MNHLKILNLDAEPFSNSPDPAFFHLSKTYMACLHDLEISIRLMRGLNIVLGDVGIGKTTLSRTLINQFQHNDNIFKFQLILDPAFNSDYEFWDALAMGFELNLPKGISLFEYKDAVRNFLLYEGLEKNKLVVLIIDEGQKLSDFCLEILRDLLNFETNEHKLLQLVILAQKEFQLKIKNKTNFTDRINTFHVLKPLTEMETQEMIEFRLKRAGWNLKRKLFSPNAIKLIFKYSKGYPRQIITICHHSLLCMLIRGKDVVTPEIVDYALSKIYDNSFISNTNARKSKYTKSFSELSLISVKTIKGSSIIFTILVLILLFTVFWGTRRINWSREAGSAPKIFYKKDNKMAKGSDNVINRNDSNPYKIDNDPLAIVPFNDSNNFTDADEFNNMKNAGDENFKHYPVFVVVKKGDTVYNLARKIYNKEIDNIIYRQIVKANLHIKDLNHIRIGQKIYFPSIE